MGISCSVVQIPCSIIVVYIIRIMWQQRQPDGKLYKMIALANELVKSGFQESES